MASPAVVERLEAVAARLERVAARLGGGGDDDDEGAPLFVTDFEAFYKEHISAVCDAANALNITDFASTLQKGYGNILDLVRASASCKKPKQGELMAFLAPGVEAINESEALKRPRGKLENHYKALYEVIMAISWVTMGPPGPLPAQHVETQNQAADFNTNRILKACKGKDDQEPQRAFVRALKAMCAEHLKYIKANFKTGLSWNPQGGDLSGYSGGGAPSGGSTATATESATEEHKEASPAKKKKKKKGATGGAGAGAASGGMAGVFGELNQGLSVTAGLKTVTADMKTKNRKNRTGKVKTIKKKKPTKKPKPRPASCSEQRGRMIVECYDEHPEVVTVDEAVLKHNVYISISDDTTFQIPNKVKAVTVDSCNKCRVYISEVVSTVEVVNSKSVTLFIQVKAPSIAIDKSSSIRVVLMPPAYEENPHIVTSNITACNLEIPGVNPDDDFIELPFPEQFLSVVNRETRTLETTETKHG